jgi:hypothetical protein
MVFVIPGRITLGGISSQPPSDKLHMDVMKNRAGKDFQAAEKVYI